MATFCPGVSSEKSQEFAVNSFYPTRTVLCLLTLLISPIFIPALHADNKVLGEVELVGATKVENTSGVWVDGQYVGYLGELKGSKKLLLLPGEHDITVRQGGYLDFNQKVLVRAGEKQTVNVRMGKDTRVALPKITAEIKLEVKPNRAAVFVDGVYVGHIAEFEGMGRGMLVAPGKHKITISLPGYQNFETEIDLVANQKSAIKTELVKGGPVEGPGLPPAQ
jgi:PEGA domain